MGTVDDDRNVGTLVAPLDSLDRHHLDALSLYRRARAKVIELRRSASQLHGGFWVFHAGGPVQPVGFVPAVAGTHAILGRHDCVDLRVPEHHTGFSLRQALLRARLPWRLVASAQLTVASGKPYTRLGLDASSGAVVVAKPVEPPSPNPMPPPKHSGPMQK